MQVQELPTKEFLAHLRRHPIPEIMDGDCLDALASVEAQYGGTITHGAGLEVRLGEEARYVDYIMNIDEKNIPGIESLWYEIDYAEFRKAAGTGEEILPCLFANTDAGKSGDAAYWDALLPPFLGETRAKSLRPALNCVIERLPRGAHIKQIGTMTSRGEIDVMRLVIMFPGWDTIPDGLAAIGWQGDAEKLREALAPWRETKSIAVNIDLGEKGVFPKIGVEVFSRWRHPLLVDKFLARLEEAGLCLPSKAEALRRWSRIRPDGDPFIQTLIAYFKLNYKDGKIAEAKAYLEQSPYVHHHYFDAYERPVRLDMELVNGDVVLPVGDALTRLWEGAKSRVRCLRFYGSVHYEQMDRLLMECRDCEIRSEIVLAEDVEREQLVRLIEAGADSFLVEIRSTAELDAGIAALSLLRGLKFSPVRAKWFLNADNAAELAETVRRVEELGASELIVAGMCADTDKTVCDFPSPEAVASAAKFIENHESGTGMKLTADSCFSPLRAYMGGEDPKKNPNRGIPCGCEAGRSFCTVRADGKITPCLYLIAAGETEPLDEYWKQSLTLAGLREAEAGEACEACTYVRRCRPCPIVRKKLATCPLV